MYVQRNIEAPWCNYFCSGKPMSITYSEYVFVASVLQQAMGMRLIIWSSVTSQPLPYFITLSRKGQDFRKKLLDTKCVF